MIMKIIAFILSLLIFGQAMTPCSDGITCGEEHVTNTHDHSQDEGDHCTPFCTCTCCGMTIMMPLTEAHVFNAKEVHFSYQFFFQFDYNFDDYYRVWHPPAAC